MLIRLNPDRYQIRYYLSIAVIACLFVPIFFRLYDLQIVRSIELTQLAKKQHDLMIDIKPTRGHIYDRTMKILATSLKVPSIYAIPRAIAGKTVTAHRLSSILDLPYGFVLERLNRDKAFVWLKRRVDQSVADKIKALNDQNIGIIFETKRFYPQGTAFSNLLGFCDIDEKGIDGLELRYEQYLSGQKGYKVTKRDAMGREIVALEEKVIPPVNGQNLVLTIDHYIQYIAERELRKAFTQYHAKGASCVVMNPMTGEVLAMVSLPDFDSNDAGASTADTRRNRAVVDFYEPGSVFKVVTASAALNEGVFQENDRVFCENGEYHITRRRVLHDVHSYGWLTVRQVIEKSSNIGAVKIAQKLGAEELYTYIKKFGFGEITGIDFPGEAEGVVRPLDQWSGYSITSIPMGQEITVTSLQMAQAMSVIANGGYLVHPFLVSRIFDTHGVMIKEYKPTIVREVLQHDVAERMGSILEGVVDEGTGRNAQIKGVRVAGKTGTAQKILPTGGYSHSNFIGSFVGFAPVDNPRVVVNVMVDDPHPVYYGGSVAAPVFREIVREVLFYLDHAEPRDTA